MSIIIRATNILMDETDCELLGLGKFLIDVFGKKRLEFYVVKKYIFGAFMRLLLEPPLGLFAQGARVVFHEPLIQYQMILYQFYSKNYTQTGLCYILILTPCLQLSYIIYSYQLLAYKLKSINLQNQRNFKNKILHNSKVSKLIQINKNPRLRIKLIDSSEQYINKLPMGNAELNCNECEVFQLEPQSYLERNTDNQSSNNKKRQVYTKQSYQNQIHSNHTPTSQLYPNNKSVSQFNLNRKKSLRQSISQSQKVDGKLKILFEGGIQYFGETQNGKREGRGKQIWPDGTFYDGEWKDDMANGKGVFHQQGGGHYEGDFKDDKFHGYGKFTTADKNLIYEGEFYEHQSHGVGTQISLTENYKYTGDFRNDLKEGYGRIDYDNGSSYEGLWKSGKFDGQGHYMSETMQYQGGWKQNKLHGYGRALWKDGRMYEGNYVNGKKEGKGTYKYSDGKKYIGEWSSGVQHGYGEIHYPDGIIKKGRWFNGKEDHSSVTY